uniref:V-SNARE coiled-coil homology domain-containing protein n=1 Tax=Oryza meridionalis TaxID=40149 RepID=A0A0E0CDB6_9ORYZ
MKITALLVLKSTGDGDSSSGGGGGEQEQQAAAVVVANATDVSHFGFFQRNPAREFILFVARTVAARTPAGRRQSVHCYNQNGLCAIAFTDDHYPVRSAFSLLNTDPAEADKLLKIQRDLDETKIILHKTIDSVLSRGERLDSLVEKSSDLSAASQMFYKQAKKTNSCCTILAASQVGFDPSRAATGTLSTVPPSVRRSLARRHRIPPHRVASQSLQSFSQCFRT